MLHSVCGNTWFNVGIVRVFLTFLWSLLFASLISVPQFLWNCWRFRHKLDFLILTLQVHYFTHYMITIVNNCLQFVELAQLMKQHYWRPGLHDNEAGTKFEALLNTFQVNSIFSLTCRWTYTANSVSHVYMQCWSVSDKWWWHISQLYMLQPFVASWFVDADMCQLYYVGREWWLDNEWCAGRMWLCPVWSWYLLCGWWNARKTWICSFTGQFVVLEYSVGKLSCTA